MPGDSESKRAFIRSGSGESDGQPRLGENLDEAECGASVVRDHGCGNDVDAVESLHRMYEQSERARSKISLESRGGAFNKLLAGRTGSLCVPFE